MILAVVVISIASLIPVAAQTTECTVGFVNGLLRLTGACGALPHHLQPPPEFTGDAELREDRTLNAKKNAKQKTQRQRRHARTNDQQAREDARWANRRATATAEARATSTAAARADATVSAQLTATAEAITNPRDDTDQGQANAADAQGDAALAQSAFEPTPTAREERQKQRTKSREQRERRQERRADERRQNDRRAETRAEEGTGIFYPTPIPQLSPEPPFVNR